MEAETLKCLLGESPMELDLIANVRKSFGELFGGLLNDTLSWGLLPKC